MKQPKETVSQLWRRELALVPIDGSNEAAFLDACRAVLKLNPTLSLDGKALHFAAQGWLAATRHAAVGA